MLSESVGTPPAVFVLLAHEVRWQILRALALSDYRVQELVALVGRPLNLVSYHLKQLRAHQLVSERRSSADRRDVYYHLDLERLHMLYRGGGDALHPAVIEHYTAGSEAPASARARILFLCTHNSARSQMAEGIARAFGQGRIEAYSAGTEPASVHPNAIRALADIGIDIRQQVSKHLDAFRGQSFDYIITVCDRVRETCPVFPDHPEHIHWSFADPAAIGDPHECYREFEKTAHELTSRIRHLMSLIERKQARQ